MSVHELTDARRKRMYKRLREARTVEEGLQIIQDALKENREALEKLTLPFKTNE